MEDEGIRSVEETETPQLPPKIALTLNGGNSEINTPTIPIEWWLGEDVIKMKPTHILFIEQDQSEIDDIHDEDAGRRYLFPIEQSPAFLQMFSSGHHRLMAIAFGSREHAKQYLKKYKATDYYTVSVDHHRVRDGNAALGSTLVEFDIPVGVFADPPQSKLGKIGWYWVKLWTKTPKDECFFRKWVVPCILLKPPVFAAYHVIRFIAGLVHALYVILASVLTVFAGFRPRPILQEIRDAIFWKRYDWSVLRYEARYLVGGNPTFRLWSYRDRKATYMPVAPFQVAGIALIAFLSYLVVTNYSWLTFLIVVAGLAATIGSGAFAYLHFDHWQDQLKSDRSKRRIDWLRKNLGLANKKDRVDLDDLPVPEGVVAKGVQKFYVGFWTLKMKVCKPYDKKA
ncbi:MAG: hypothetical protein HGA31_05550 [Candidatus Moranbacteria bacterium]|nr:hypothetical protein [Candidatus Moranbacteria bacterium]